MRYVIPITVTQRAEPHHRTSVAARRKAPVSGGGLRMPSRFGHFSSPRGGLPERFFGRVWYAVRAAAIRPEAAAASLVC
jgi:hypothetical protein